MPTARITMSLATLGALLALVGCREAPPTPRVVNKAVPSLDTIPALVILDTILEAEPRLQLPTGATRLSNGWIVVSDQWAQAVRFFDQSGTLVRTVGRGGQGPGEFTAPSWLGQCSPDLVFVWDYMQSQMSVIDSTGTVVREYTPPRNLGGGRCSQGGRFVTFGQPLETPRSIDQMLAMRAAAPLCFEDAEGDSIGGVGIVPMGEGWILGKRTQYAITDDRLYVGTADSASLDVHDMDGKRIGAIPLSITPREPSEANIEAWLEDQWDMFQDTEYRERGKQMFRARSKVAEHLPLYTGLAVDPEGVIWVVLSSPGDGETRFQAVAADGALLAELRIPTELKLFEVGHDYLLGLVYHETGIPGIALYRIHRDSP